VLSTVVALQSALGVAGAVVLAGFAVALPVIFPAMPHAVERPAQITVALLGASALCGIVTTALSGYYLTLRRLVVPSSITFLSRAAGAVAVVAMALGGVGIVGLAVAWTVITLAGNVVVTLAFGRLGVPVRPSLVSRDLARRMLRFSGAYAVWVLAGFLVVGLDTTIVGHLDFSMVAPYTAAAAAVTVIAAVYGSALAPLVPAAGDLTAANQPVELGALLVRSSRVGGALVVGAAALMGLFAHPILALWVGASLAASGTTILQVLAVATALRMLVMPYPVLLFGSGEHGRAWATPLAEGGVNVVASVLLGVAFGAIGVAIGTLIGAVLGAALHVWFNVPRTRSLTLSARAWVRGALLRPAIALLAMAGVMGIAREIPLAARWLVAPIAVMAVAACAWWWILTDADRSHLVARVGGRLPWPSPRLDQQDLRS
jgi:O-antigen/teichoic acid export membrane protein